MTVPRRRVLFVTGTRADFGKLQPLIQAVENLPTFECIIFATGMHTLETYGYTVTEVQRGGFKNIHVYMNQMLNEPMDLVLANSIAGIARFVHENPPDMMVVHGDRIEALAGAAVGALRNILVAHIEGGEVSGTVDDLIRHAVTKLAHIHFVANGEAAARLRQMGEREESVFVIGSPDIDVMNSADLPSLKAAKEHYEIPFDTYSIALFHPVTTEIERMRDHAREFVDALIESSLDYVVIYPNNDEGAVYIMEQYQRLRGSPRFRLFPSVRFELFLTLLKNARLIVGNSSAGIREAPFYGRYAVNVGSRQTDRFKHPTIINTGYTKDEILRGLQKALSMPPARPSTYFGDGKSRDRFINILLDGKIFETPRQKKFVDVFSISAAAQ
jgi:UDP-N-acetylglucosamine 2-epimerase (hydrolysing)